MIWSRETVIKMTQYLLPKPSYAVVLIYQGLIET